ncbi:MAG: SDR family NAD(P)-dependent oxidoreductase [Phycisphaerae bacterium]|jgi:acyl transferase domain-containing protein/NAD(P)H-dependent flavin oxidoreductase YrpB (nitropropane dioxygenase family)/NAD(P)-dependent dehydrogenase (short-subunit alcohol dehydrogenase family)/acyl carrier protein
MTSRTSRGAGPLDIAVASLGATWDPALPIAAARAGALGLLDLSELACPRRAADATHRLVALANGRHGLVLRARLGPVEDAALGALNDADTIALHGAGGLSLEPVVERCRRHARQIALVASSAADAQRAAECGVDFIVAKGHESGGRVGEETTFILLQRLLDWGRLPVYAWGGIGWHSAAACAAAGAAGVVLDWQLSLVRESPLPAPLRARIAAMDGTETAVVSGPSGEQFRLYHRPSMGARDVLAGAEPSQWDATIERLANTGAPEQRLFPVGQDAAFAAAWAARAPTAARAIAILREEIARHLGGCASARALAPDGPLAQSHGTRYPIVQGPMTRVSDVPEFAEAVAANGALPFLALALMRKNEVRTLLERTRDLVAGRPWGVGILGFAERDIRAEQLEALEEVRPPFAIIAGGRPDQAAAFEAKGITTYLHVPTPGMLKMFLAEGARRFIFEGRECGGHVGPLASSVLWDTMIRVLLEARLKDEQAQQVHVLFAGGIHDARSASMVAALAQPLVERGMKIGVLVGTGYLFTEEIVATGAALKGFQDVAIESRSTILLTTGPGHSIRCADTEYVHKFQQQRLELERSGRPHEEVRAELEAANIGRLRIASKGVARDDSANDDSGGRRLLQLDDAEQRRNGIYMLGQVAGLRDRRVPMRALHEDICAGSAARLRDVAPRADAVPAAERAAPAPQPFDIAIVGIACFVPGANSVEEFWRNILRKHDCIVDIPYDRFDLQRWYDPDKTARDKIYGTRGGFIGDIPFDPLKFGIPPTTLRHVEPVHFLALELAYRALRDAGYHDYNPYRVRTGVILGVGAGAAEMSTRYAFRAMIPQFIQNPDESLWSQLPEWTEDSFAGILPNVVAGRITNRLNLGGPNYTVDAACAAGLAAVAQACRELTLGTADMVISGGADTAQNPLAFHCLSSTRALSEKGRTAAFDEAADGLVNSEGLTFFVLKRRADAERDGDRIYAIIRGVGASADAQTKGLTAPSADGQRRALQAAYDQAGFSPATVGLFEAHGTGTARGDVTECQSLMMLLAEHGATPRFAALGSAKSNVGHTKCNAGAVGLMKAALALYHRVLPPTIHVTKPNPKANIDENAPVYLNSELRPWIRGEHPRRAGVFAAGFGGTNFHAVLEEYVGDPVERAALAPDRQRAAELFCFGGTSRAELAAGVRKLLTELNAAVVAEAEFSLADLAYTLYRREPRPSGAVRAAVVASDVSELAARLAALLAGLEKPDERADLPRSESGMLRPGVYFSEKLTAAEGKLAFLFPGQGSQHPDMFRDLAVDFAEVAERFERADRALAGRLDRALSRFVFPPPPFTDAERRAAFEALKATQVAQPALGACGVAALRLLNAFGLRADMTGGHSYGELVALHAAGALSEDALYRLSWQRGDSIVSMTGGGNGNVRDLGQMLAVRADEAAVRAALGDVSECWIANCNSPTQTVISGTRAGLERARERLDGAGLTCVAVPVACAFHSPIMKPARERFAAALAETEFAHPRLDVYSNTYAAAYATDPEQIRGTLAEQLIREVRFAAEIEAMYAAGARVFIEAGPGNVLTRLVREVLGSRPHLAVAIQKKDEHGVVRFVSALAELIVGGAAVDMQRYYEGRSLQLIDLAALAKAGKTQYPRHYWFVNGGYCRPVTDPPRDPQPRARLESGEPAARESTTTEQPGENVRVPGLQTAQIAAAAAPAPAVAQPAPAAYETGAHEAAQQQVFAGPTGVEMAEGSNVYAEFQETMRRFLETQKAVMEAYLSGASATTPAPSAAVVRPAAAPRVDAPVVVAAPTLPAVTPTPPVASAPPIATVRDVARAAPAPAATTPAPTAATPAIDLKQLLLETVAQRTGYPTDVLDLNANLEAELGVDSIKRVEIIGAFRRQAVPDLTEPPAWFMERMTSVKSLQEILDGVAELAGKPAAPPAVQPIAAAIPAAARPAPSAAAAVDLRQILLETVAQRTGYPPEVLDLNANLEAELGIDSIKRVEIIGAFRRQAVPEMSEPPAWFMERMTSVKSLQEILDGVAALIGKPAPAAAAPVAVPPAPAAPKLDLKQLLLDTVAQRTGYPVEVLDLNANLEAELGIDSIKRVEIIGAFRRQAIPDMKDPPAWFMERMTSVKSLQEILDGMARLIERPSGEEAPAAPMPEPAAAAAKAAAARLAPASDVERCPRCVPLVVELPLDGETVHRPPDGVFILTDDGRGVARALEAALRARGARVAVLGPEALASREAAAQAVAEVRARDGAPCAVVHMRPLQEARTFPEIDAARWQALCDEELKGALFLMQAVAAELSASKSELPMFFACLSIGGGDFDDYSESEAVHPWRGGLAGLLKCAAKEWTRARFRAIDLDDLPNGALPDLLLREFHAAGPVEVGYREGRRLGLQMVRADFDTSLPPQDPPLLRRGSVVLITGGARGITAAIAQELAERVQPILVLAGRSPLPEDREDPETAGIEDLNELRKFLLERARRAGRKPTPKEIESEVRALLAEREIRHNLQALRSAGAKVEYHCCDVRDTAVFERLIRHTREHHGRIDAVVHGAGVIEDKFIADKSAESFDRVLSTKVQSLLTLCHGLNPAETKLLMLFSSVAGALGNPGQGDYAAANETLNRIARRLRSVWPGRIVAMNWGAWTGAGMVTPEVARQFAERGVGMVSVPAGRTAAWDEIVIDGGSAARVLIGPGPWVDEADRAGAAIRVDRPLLAGHAVARRSADVLEATVVLDGSRFAYLSDHRIDGKPVLPMIVAMEMMAELAAAGQPNMAIERILDVRQLAGVVVEGPRREVLVRAERIECTSETAEWRVRLSDARSSARPLYQAMVHLARNAPPAPPAPELEAISNPFPLSVAEAYERWLFHGPAFRVIEQFEGVAEIGIDAVIRPSCQRSCVGPHAARPWLIDPIALDAAPHMASLWSRALFGTTQLPSRIAAYHCFGPLGEGPVRVVMRSRVQSDGTVYNFDVWFIRDGKVLGRMEALEGAGNEALNRITQGVH